MKIVLYQGNKVSNVISDISSIANIYTNRYGHFCFEYILNDNNKECLVTSDTPSIENDNWSEQEALHV